MFNLLKLWSQFRVNYEDTANFQENSREISWNYRKIFKLCTKCGIPNR